MARLSLAEAAAVLGIHKRTLQRWVQEGHVEAVWIKGPRGREIQYVETDDVTRYQQQIMDQPTILIEQDQSAERASAEAARLPAPSTRSLDLPALAAALDERLSGALIAQQQQHQAELARALAEQEQAHAQQVERLAYALGQAEARAAAAESALAHERAAARKRSLWRRLLG